MKVSVIIPTYNEEKDIEKCLKSLRSQNIKDIEIIVVDDGSTDKTLQIVKKFEGIIVIKGEHKGPGFSRNIGARKAIGNILIFVDADMTFEKDYIKNLVKPILENKTEKIIGTTHDYEIATNIDNVWSSLWGKIRVSNNSNDVKISAKDVKIFRAIRKNKFLELGGFDSRYGYADDQTFWFKYKIRPIVAENTTCYHKNPSSLEETCKQAKWIGASWKEKFLIFRIPLINYVSVFFLFLFLPTIVFLKVIETKLKKKKYSLKNLIKFYSVKFLGYAKGIFRAVYFGEVWK